MAPGVIRERLIAFDPEAMSLTYEAVDGMPGFVGRAINRWSVHRTRSDGSRVLDELRHRVEQGRPHPRKVEAMARETQAS